MFDGCSNNLFYFKDMPLEVSHISYFPNDNGQVLVANITVSQRMQKLYANVREIVAKIGLGMDLRSFKPHITLARFKENISLFWLLVLLYSVPIVMDWPPSIISFESNLSNE